MSAPGFWRNETSGVLRPAIERYLARQTKPDDIPILRAYLRQWIWADGFKGDAIEMLRRTVHLVADLESLDLWISQAVDAGCDPL